MTATKELENFSKIFKALSHPHRLGIVIGLYHNECSVLECQNRMCLPQSTISQHLKTLKEAGIIEGRREGTTVCYKVINNFVVDLINKIEE
ncbi:transcriptional regulator [candidate division KSB1 bacterium]|nr:MAG: transcriptional regulator [candidate division KSB1 bacterium]